jgi:phosphoserine phosphatase
VKKYLILFFFCACSLLYADNAEEVCSQILSLKDGIARSKMEKNPIFITFWNFDNTILNGDTSEGSVDEDGRVIFKGMAQVAIEAGLSKKYPKDGGFERFCKDYKRLEQQDEPKAYAYMAQILAGAREKDVLSLSTQYFKSTLKNHFFSGSVDLIRCLQKQGILVWVITASPELFVKGASPFLNIPLEEISGMQTEVKNGVLTDKMVLPLVTAKGKIQKIQQIVKKLEKEQRRKVYILAGFGNDNPNDIEFLKWIEGLQLPSGKPYTMISNKLALINENTD